MSIPPVLFWSYGTVTVLTYHLVLTQYTCPATNRQRSLCAVSSVIWRQWWVGQLHASSIDPSLAQRRATHAIIGRRHAGIYVCGPISFSSLDIHSEQATSHVHYTINTPPSPTYISAKTVVIKSIPSKLAAAQWTRPDTYILGVRGSWPMKIYRRGQNMFWPPPPENVTFFHSKL